jgi:hypothetical protein
MVLSEAHEIKAEGLRFGVHGAARGRPWLRLGQKRQALQRPWNSTAGSPKDLIPRIDER